MITHFGKCSDDMTRDEMLLWFSNMRKKKFEDAIAEILDFYTHAHTCEKNLIEDCLCSVDFLREAFDVQEEKERGDDEEEDQLSCL